MKKQILIITSIFMLLVLAYSVSAATIEIFPDNPMQGEQLTCNVAGSTGDNYIYMWYKNGQLVSQYQSKIIPAAVTAENEIWNCKVYIPNPFSGLTFIGEDTVTISKKVTPQPPELEIKSIDCFSPIPVNGLQACKVLVTDDKNQAVRDVDIDVYFSDTNIFFGSCTTGMTGGCDAQRIMERIGTYTVYATAKKPGYINDTDKNPTDTFQVYRENYIIKNLVTYNDSKFMFPDKIFYRGEPLYVSFEVFEKNTGRRVDDAEIVSKVYLRSLTEKGESELNKIRYENGIYYFSLTPIPATHDYNGTGRVFAFAINFNDQTAGESVADITILNNKPIVDQINPIYVYVGETQTIELEGFGYDKEQDILQWKAVTPNTNIYTAEIEGISTLRVHGWVEGTSGIELRAYDYDGEYGYATTQIIVSRRPVADLTAVCTADRTRGDVPLAVNFEVTASGGAGPGTYSYNWDFVGTGIYNTRTASKLMHTYIDPGFYKPTVKVTDTQGRAFIADCPDINVTTPGPQDLKVTCDVNTVFGRSIPFTPTFTATATGGSGRYNAFFWEYGDGSSGTQGNVVSHSYTSAGNFTAKVTVYESTGKTTTGICPTVRIIPGDSGAGLVADPNGPYFGYYNEPVTFDGSESKGNITSYVWNFGDGTAQESFTPFVNHVYSMPGIYEVTLTVYDGKGNHASASTKATIIERGPAKKTEEKEPEKGLYVGRIIINGRNGEIIRPDDQVTITVDVENNFEYELDNARLRVEILELGLLQKSHSFDLERGEDETITMVVPFYDVPPGTYYMKILIGDDEVRRVKYREIIVKK